VLAATQIGCVEAEMTAVVAYAPAAAACGAQAMPGRLCGCVYDVPVETRRLPDVSLLRPVELLCTDRLAVSVRNGPPGFPGVQGRYEWYAIDFQGELTVAQPGVFHFRLTSDDGSKLVLDDAMVLNNDGYHHVRSVEAAVPLAAGVHRVRVPYWEGPGPIALTLEVARDGEQYQVLRFDRPL
jgi:hypothetical protein